MTQKVNKGVKKIFRNLKAFSLVELIIVIAIVAILSVAGFMTLQKRISQSRDSKRLGDLETIEKSLTINYTDQDTAELYPMPDENNDGSTVTTGEIEGETVAYKGTFGSGAIENVDNLNEVPVDPLDDDRYAYGVTENQQYFQVAAVLENGEKVSLNVTNRVYAADKKSTVRGNYDGLMVYTKGGSDYIANIPSLIFNNTGSLTNTGEVSYVVDGSSNLAYGEDTTQKESFEEVVRETYSLSSGANISFVKTGVDKLKDAIESGTLDKNIENSLGGNEGVIESKLKESGINFVEKKTSYIAHHYDPVDFNGSLLPDKEGGSDLQKNCNSINLNNSLLNGKPGLKIEGDKCLKSMDEVNINTPFTFIFVWRHDGSGSNHWLNDKNGWNVQFHSSNHSIDPVGMDGYSKENYWNYNEIILTTIIFDSDEIKIYKNGEHWMTGSGDDKNYGGLLLGVGDVVSVGEFFIFNSELNNSNREEIEKNY